MVDTTVALRLIQGRPWHHDFEIVPGVRTHGSYNPIHLWNELRLPEDLRGTTLADVGASNGFFSFEARRRGSRVAAFDFRHKDNSGFGLAQYINGMSDIEHHQVNVLDITAEHYGEYDVVLALGLYHTVDPFKALKNCAALSRKRLVGRVILYRREPPSGTAERTVDAIHAGSRALSIRWGRQSRSQQLLGLHVGLSPADGRGCGFSVQRVDVTSDRVFIDAERAVTDPTATRLWLAYDLFPAVPAGPNRDEPAAWTIL